MRERVSLLWQVRLWLIRFLQRFRYPSHIYYLGNHEALPPPLTSEEELALLSKLETGISL